MPAGANATVLTFDELLNYKSSGLPAFRRTPHF